MSSFVPLNGLNLCAGLPPPPFLPSPIRVCPLLPKGVSALEYRPPRSALPARDYCAQLLSTALERREGPEQVLASLFAALLRSLGLMVRTAHVLQALPRTPTAQEDHLTALWAAEGGQGKGGLAGNKRCAGEGGFQGWEWEA